MNHSQRHWSMVSHFFETSVVNINMVTWVVFLMNVPCFGGVDTGYDNSENNCEISFKAVCNSVFYPLLWAIHHIHYFVENLWNNL